MKHQRSGRPEKPIGTHVCRARIIWERVNGPIPEGMEIDHINRNPRDNRLENLRLCTREQNNSNRRKYVNNTSGYKGVWVDKKSHRWYVKVKAGATLIHQSASHKISAIVASRLLRRILHGNFVCQG